MRPRKPIVLLMKSQVAAGHWRFVINTWGHYEVLLAWSLTDAERLLSERPDCDVVLTDIEGPLGADALADYLRHNRVLLFGIPRRPEDTLAMAVELARDDIPESLAFRVRAALGRLCARKRGPKPYPRVAAEVMSAVGTEQVVAA